jgi:hypothetical protein
VFEIARSLFRTDVSRKEAKSQRRRCGGVGWGDCGVSFYRSAILLGRTYERSEAFLGREIARSLFLTDVSRKEAKSQRRRCGGVGWGDCGVSFYRSAILLGRTYERSEAFLCLRLRDRYF